MVDTKNTFKKEKILKFTRQTILVLLLFVLSFILNMETPSVKGSFVVAGVQTRIILKYEGKKYNFLTYRNRLEDALKDQGIETYDQDLFSTPRDMVLNGQEIKVEVNRSWPVMIDDNGQKIHGRTVYGEPLKILEQNKIEVWPEDIVDSELILNPIEAGGAGQQVLIKRAPVYKVLVDGKTKEVRDWEGDVGAIIEKSATKLNPNDIVSPKIGEKVSSGSTIVITRINYADVSNTESIPFTTVYEGSTSIAFGTIKSMVSGITGSKKNTYRVTYKDGQEVSRRLISSTVTQQKRDAKIIRGAVTGVCKWGPYYETNYGPYTTAFHYPGYKGRYILVTNLANGKSVKVKVVDLGPTNGLLDLSTTAMREIGGPRVTFFGKIDKVSVQLLD
jgi:uncharacterized protein YabE (DUF348 family)